MDGVNVKRLFIGLCNFAVVCFAAAGYANTLISLTDHHYEHTYDQARNLLYIPTKLGTVERYDIESNQLLSPVVIGNNLRGSDITPDSRFLYVTDFEKTGMYPELYKIDLDTLDYHTIEVSKNGLKGLADITITSNNLALITGGPVPLSGARMEIMALDITSDTWASGPHGRFQDSRVVSPAYSARAADRSLAIFVSSGTTGDFVKRFDTQLASFRPVEERILGWNKDGAFAVSRDGALLAIEEKVYQPDATLVHEFPFNSFHIGGLAFDPLQDVMYLADRRSEEVVAYDSDTWEEIGRISVGEDLGVSRILPESNYISTSGDGSLLFVTTLSGVRMLENPFAVPEPSTNVIMALFGVGGVGVFVIRRINSAQYCG